MDLEPQNTTEESLNAAFEARIEAGETIEPKDWPVLYVHSAKKSKSCLIIPRRNCHL